MHSVQCNRIPAGITFADRRPLHHHHQSLNNEIIDVHRPSVSILDELPVHHCRQQGIALKKDEDTMSAINTNGRGLQQVDEWKDAVTVTIGMKMDCIE